MKRTILRLTLLLVAGLVFAQEYFLVNETESTLYVTQGNASTVREALLSNESLRQVPSDGLLPIGTDARLVGFAFSRETFALPTVRLEPIEITARAERSESGRRYLTIRDDLLDRRDTINPAELAETLGGPRIDNQYLDWVTQEPRIARGRTRAPLGVFADLGGGRESTPLQNSLLWGRAGTDLQWIKSVTRNNEIFLAGSAYTQVARGTTLFLYFYEDGNDLPTGTLELPIGNQGLALLWSPERAFAEPAGNVLSDGFLFEAQIWPDSLADLIGDGADVRVEVATAGQAGGVWEEFVLAQSDFEVLFPR